MSAASRLGALLGRDEASAVAAALRQRHLPHLAAQRAFPLHRAEVKLLLSDLIATVGGADLAAAVLDGIAAVPRTTCPEPVWTTPNVPGIEGRTTLAVADMINRAERSVYAATYSASSKAEYVQALTNAIDRGVSVTIVLDRGMQEKNGGAVPKALAGARMWAYAPEPAGSWTPLQHAKLVVIDGNSALVTSANFSDSAARVNLECGLLSRDPEVAGGLVRQLETLYQQGALVDF
ncbi:MULTISPECIES: DISARM system phospholipase D-like protein DrmC [Gordonia]|uniref:phospholipase D n=1 Tax=Gordonia amicalis TaxID=89053 RepID=A0AAE4R7Y1_9ACTN|nr:MULTISPECIES: DISARM system phospholipase D-like protein DrmC [Gordonia]MCZ4581321.1 DISARM system phospholipase D-like protein DrmC [Gordonia amicalis]MCZ4653869.1 DISARM system phospholipase D-like protein DrmC [Gordonia amicalis]MDJ0455396.1 DISARM system phospholipase D-like protein DrmC [Gordonia amicalis]MDV6307439.1 DISARM system phospholipase D-like protein DrmC [Gordonia amicalis]MDV6314699.1 DISARM system phospholipase D-like protein DrmC [Gordonia amicalis]